MWNNVKTVLAQHEARQVDLDAGNIYTCSEPVIFPYWDAVSGFRLEETLFSIICIGLHRSPKHEIRRLDRTCSNEELEIWKSGFLAAFSWWLLVRTQIDSWCSDQKGSYRVELLWQDARSGIARGFRIATIEIEGHSRYFLFSSIVLQINNLAIDTRCMDRSITVFQTNLSSQTFSVYWKRATHCSKLEIVRAFWLSWNLSMDHRYSLRRWSKYYIAFLTPHFSASSTSQPTINSHFLPHLENSTQVHNIFQTPPERQSFLQV